MPYDFLVANGDTILTPLAVGGLTTESEFETIAALEVGRAFTTYDGDRYERIKGPSVMARIDGESFGAVVAGFTGDLGGDFYHVEPTEERPDLAPHRNDAGELWVPASDVVHVPTER